MRKDTRTDLVEALSHKPPSAGLREIVDLAKRGEFHDYKNTLFDAPKAALVMKLARLGPEFRDIIDDVMEGKYDEEADESDVAMLKRDWLKDGGTEESWALFFEKKNG